MPDGRFAVAIGAANTKGDRWIQLAEALCKSTKSLEPSRACLGGDELGVHTMIEFDPPEIVPPSELGCCEMICGQNDRLFRIKLRERDYGSTAEKTR